MRVPVGSMTTDEAIFQECIAPEPNGVYARRIPVADEPVGAAPKFTRMCRGSDCLMGWRFMEKQPRDLDRYDRLTQLGYCGLAGKPNEAY